MTDAETTPEYESVVEYLQAVIQKALHEYPGDSGPALLGDWLLVAEGHTGDGVHLRIIDNDLPFWRRFGLVRFVDQQGTADLAGNVAWGAAQSYNQDWEDGDDGAGV